MSGSKQCHRHLSLEHAKKIFIKLADLKSYQPALTMTPTIFSSQMSELIMSCSLSRCDPRTRKTIKVRVCMWYCLRAEIELPLLPWLQYLWDNGMAQLIGEMKQSIQEKQAVTREHCIIKHLQPFKWGETHPMLQLPQRWWLLHCCTSRRDKSTQRLCCPAGRPTHHLPMEISPERDPEKAASGEGGLAHDSC